MDPRSIRCLRQRWSASARARPDHRMRRNHLKGRGGDRSNAVLAAAGYNFSLLLRWFTDDFICGAILCSLVHLT